MTKTEKIVMCISNFRCGFELANRFIGHSLVVPTNNYNTFKFTVTVTHKKNLLNLL
jgi:hypothetical protein